MLYNSRGTLMDRTLLGSEKIPLVGTFWVFCVRQAITNMELKWVKPVSKLSN